MKLYIDTLKEIDRITTKLKSINIAIDAIKPYSKSSIKCKAIYKELLNVRIIENKLLRREQTAIQNFRKECKHKYIDSGYGSGHYSEAICSICGDVVK